MNVPSVSCLVFFATLAQVIGSSAEAQPTADGLTSREYKVLLRSERFGSPADAANEFWDLALQTAIESEVRATGTMDERKEREVSFRDTPKHRLRCEYKLVYRERVKLKDGELDDEKKVTLKFRGDDQEEAAEQDVSPAMGKEEPTKLEEDIVPEFEGDTVALDPRYSHSGTTEIDTSEMMKKIKHLRQVYPTLEGLSIKGKKRLSRVNDFTAHEVKIEGGGLVFGVSTESDASFSLWHEDDPKGPLLAAEFSFSYDLEDQSEGAEAAARSFFLKLVERGRAADWVDPDPRTKTSIAYGGNCP